MIESKRMRLYPHQTVTVDFMKESLHIPCDSLRFTERTGKWSAIDVVTAQSRTENTVCIAIFALFENDYWGDETDYIVAYYDYYSGDNNWKEIDGTFDDLKTALFDIDII